MGPLCDFEGRFVGAFEGAGYGNGVEALGGWVYEAR